MLKDWVLGWATPQVQGMFVDLVSHLFVDLGYFVRVFVKSEQHHFAPSKSFDHCWDAMSVQWVWCRPSCDIALSSFAELPFSEPSFKAAGYPSEYTRGLSNLTIHSLFHSCENGDSNVNPLTLCNDDKDSTESALVLILLLAAAVRFAQVTVTFGTGMPCGLFVPSLYVGACCSSAGKATHHMIKIYIYSTLIAPHMLGISGNVAYVCICMIT